MTCILSFIQKHKLQAIVLEVVFTVLALMVLVRIPKKTEIPILSDQNGVYDLTGYTDLDTSVIQLSPGSAYYPNMYIMPEDIDASVPVGTEYLDELQTE